MPLAMLALAACGDDDQGGAPDGGGTCLPVVVPAPVEAECEAETLDCLNAADTDEEWNDCLDADEDTDECIGCIAQAFDAECTAAGCAEEYGALVCCVDANCDDDDDDCVGDVTAPGGPCAAAEAGYVACQNATPTCDDIPDTCFATD